ncbi:START domain-containing protein [Pseudomonas phoenicis]|uniref:START domain-containing protein n=1 Tax=unclassified Pseudomonas TaxID=196821 RepID=UPI0039A37CD5
MRSIKRIALLCGIGALLAPLAQAQTWQVAKDEEGIKVSLSEVAGSKYKAYKGETLIKAPLAKVLAVQEDVAGACAWVHECKMQKLLKHEGDQTWTYTQFNTPWPVTPRDSVLRITTSKGADGSVTRQIEEAPTLLPEEKGFVRVAQVEGFWKMVPEGGGTRVTYQVHTEPGGSVPSWLANKFVVDAPFNTLKHLRERVERP